MNTRRNKAISLRVSIPTSPDGTVGRKCPGCRRFFKVDRETMKEADQICPYCGAQHPTSQFLTLDQRRRLRSAAQRYAMTELHRQMTDAFQGFSSSGSGMIRVELQPGQLELPPLLTYVEQDTRRTVTCSHCGAATCVYGIALFCARCGRRESMAAFEQALHAAEASLAAVELLLVDQRRALEAIGGLDRLAENVLGDIVTAFEGYCRTKITEIAGAAKLASLQKTNGANFLQRLDIALQAMSSTLGRPLLSAFPASEFDELKVAFATRHVLIHNLGIADAKYAAAGGPVPVGQRVQVTTTVAKRAIRLVDQLVHAMA